MAPEHRTINLPVNDEPGFNPVYITDEDLLDLSTFSGLSKTQCLSRLRSYSMRELANLWRATSPQNAEEITAFYETAHPYVWELMAWHASPSRENHRALLAHITETFPPSTKFQRVLDFGCGVGTDGMFLAQLGYDVTLMDVDGPAFRFAKHRVQRRGLPARFVESRWPLPSLDGPYDIIVCFDVFEHLPDPLHAARTLVQSLRPGGLLVEKAAFSDEGDHPQHLAPNITRFQGVRWHIWLTSLGLRPVAKTTYQKCSGIDMLSRKVRFLFWRLTGIWVSWIDPRGDFGHPSTAAARPFVQPNRGGE